MAEAASRAASPSPGGKADSHGKRRAPGVAATDDGRKQRARKGGPAAAQDSDHPSIDRIDLGAAAAACTGTRITVPPAMASRIASPGSPASLQSSPMRASPRPAGTPQRQARSDDCHVQQLLATSPRPGGLLESMRARGTLQVAASPAMQPAARRSPPMQPAASPALMPGISPAVATIQVAMSSQPQPAGSSRVLPVVAPAIAGTQAGSPATLSPATFMQQAPSPRPADVRSQTSAASTPKSTGSCQPSTAGPSQSQGASSSQPSTGSSSQPASASKSGGSKASEKEKIASTPTAKKAKAGKGGGKSAKRASLVGKASKARRAQTAAAAAAVARQPQIAPQPVAAAVAAPGAAAGFAEQKVAIQQPDEPWRRFREKPLPPKKQEDNWEISDKEDSDDEGADEEQDRNRANKPVPTWCVDYKQALAAQEGVDPDSIFSSRVPFCDIDAIFPDTLYRERGRKPPKRKRGSSCQWAKDRLSSSNIARYRAKMGQLKRWSSIKRSSSIKRKVISLEPGEDISAT